MAYNIALPFPIGSVRTNVDANLVGEVFSVGDKAYMLVKSTGSITGAGLFVQFADAEAATVDAVTGAAEVKGAVAGLCDSAQVAIVSGDYFFVQRKGRGTATTATTGLVAQVAVATTGTAGKIDDATVTYATAIAWTTAAQASADSSVEVLVDLP